MSQASLTQIRRILRECQYNPRQPGTMKIVADNGDINYYMTRAIEAIQTSRAQNNFTGGLRQAIQLLVLALAELENGQAKTPNKG